MSEIAISRSHGMTVKKAKLAAEGIAAELAEEFDFTYAWNGNALDFSRPGVVGTISVGKQVIDIRAKLGFLLAMLRPKIEKEIHRFCDEKFGPEN